MSTKTTLKPLPLKRKAPYGFADVINSPWRLLEGAHNSVSSLLDAFQVVHSERARSRGENRGRLSHDETEILRAALVFTSSGLDATLRRLVTAAVPPLVARPTGGARTKYEEYVKNEIKAPSPSGRFSDAVQSLDPTKELVEAYVAAKTGASYQGSGDVKRRVREILGISKSAVSDATVDALDPFFTARNLIVHDMDYSKAKDLKTTSRSQRSLQATVDECHRAFELCAQLINATSNQLSK